MSPLPFFEFYVKMVYFIDPRINNPNIPSEGKIIEMNQFFSDFLIVFMFFRLFFLYRCVINYNLYTDAYSKKVCQ